MDGIVDVIEVGHLYNSNFPCKHKALKVKLGQAGVRKWNLWLVPERQPQNIVRIFDRMRWDE